MAAEAHASEYLLGHSEAEHERLIRQAAILAPITEAFFREAGIGVGQRVLDLGSGVGDVAMLAARLVGPSGEVVGVERDTRSIQRAEARCSEAGLHNARFLECDIGQIPDDGRFDAVVGRYILQFHPDPVSVVRSASQLARPGGAVAFQENAWAPFIHLCARLPLLSACVDVLYETAQRFGVHTELGVELHRTYRDAGLPKPTMRLEIPLGNDPDFTRWAYDSISSSMPSIKKLGLSIDALGDLGTLQARLHEEAIASDAIVPLLPLGGAWSRKPIA